MEVFSNTRWTSNSYRMNENEISSKIIGACIEVHRQLRPGLLESSYENCLVMS